MTWSGIHKTNFLATGTIFFLQFLQDSYDFCEVIAQQQLQGIVERLVYPTDPEINEVRIFVKGTTQCLQLAYEYG